MLGRVFDRIWLLAMSSNVIKMFCRVFDRVWLLVVSSTVIKMFCREFDGSLAFGREFDY